jgi:undecaprenyl-diphosphatase
MEQTGILHAAILGFLQGISEFLPISSSAHLLLANWFMSGKALPLELEVALHLGTFVALLVYFHSYWIAILEGLWRKFRYSEDSFVSSKLFPALIIGSIPAALIGVWGGHIIEELFYNPLSIVIPMGLVGILLWLIDSYAPSRKDLKKLTYKDAFLIGITQAFALIPGVSRSGATIIGGRLLGLEKKDAVEFSFLLGTPVMFGAALLHAKGILSYIGSPIFYVGVSVSFFVGYLTIKYFIQFISRFNFLIFALYRVALCFVILWFMRPH